MTMRYATYDPEADLPTAGTWILEASAGTGKTYAIKQLVARYISETDIGLDQMLIMTFTRSAAGELRDRIRSELWHMLQGADGDARSRLEVAISRMDDASIGTTHEFCSNAFARLGVRADADPGMRLIDELQDVVLDAATDAYLRRPQQYLDADLPSADALGIADIVSANPGIPILPDPDDGTRPGYGEDVRRGIAGEQRRLGIVTYDDLVLRLRDALRHRTNGPRVAQALRQQYRVVLIDEFQDTDPAQWDIVRRAFYGHSTLFLVGDPKQGIYAFRGADIHSYLDAARHADSVQTLGTNHRSDAAVVDGVLELLQVGDPPLGMALGDPKIAVGPVAAKITAARLSGAGLDDGRRVRLRLLTDHEKRSVVQTRDAVAQDAAADIARLLAAGPVLQTDTGPEALAPRHIAVIVRTNRHARTVRDALRGAGLHAVINSTESVFASRAAEAMLLLLRAMERPSGNALRTAVLAGLFAPGPADLAVAEDAAMEQAAERVRSLNDLVRSDGIPSLVTAVTTDPALLQRSLAYDDGERFLTDLRHIGGILHAESRNRGRGLVGLADWLAEEIGLASQGGQEQAEALTRRLESDADAVQVLTIHRCKGLQFPVTYVPYGWDLSAGNRRKQGVVFHDARRGRVIDVGDPSGTRRATSDSTAAAEDAGEELRMLYVAVTRAASLLVITGVDNTAEHTKKRIAPLDRVLFARSLGHTSPERSYTGPLPIGQFEHIRVERFGPGEVASEPMGGADAAAAPAADELAVAPYDRADIDAAWTRASFTALVRGAEHRPMDLADGAAAGEKDDEPDAESGPDEAGSIEPPLTTPSPMAALPAGTAFGTLVHAVFEHTDTAAPDLPAELELRCREHLAARPIGGAAPDDLARALLPVLRTPLGHLAPGTTLADVPLADRLAELDFELPMHQERDSVQTLGAIGALLAEAEQEPDWVREYGRDLRGAPIAWKQLRGYLTGSIDAVLRIGGRYYVVDYKTNRLGNTLGDYHPAALPKAMASANYPLQALLYGAALHRFLRLRQPGYGSEQHLGGILYLFVRGMAGPDTPTDAAGDPCGVFAWRPGPRLVGDVSALLGGESA